MKYLLLYLVAGVVTLIMAVIQSRIVSRKHSKLLSEQLTELKFQSASAWKRLVHEYVVPIFAGLLVILLWPAAAFMLINGELKGIRQDEGPIDVDFTVATRDLLEELTIDEIEQREMIDDPLGAVPDQPFGHLWPAWQRFKESLQPGVVLWSFESAYEPSWEASETISGYVVVSRSRLGPHFLTYRKITMNHDTAILGESLSQI